MAHSQSGGGVGDGGGNGIYHNGVSPYRGQQLAPEDQYQRQQLQQQQQQQQHNFNRKSQKQYSQRAFTLDEALPYTPFTSVFPFESGKNYLPTFTCACPSTPTSRHSVPAVS